MRNALSDVSSVDTTVQCYLAGCSPRCNLRELAAHKHLND